MTASELAGYIDHTLLKPEAVLCDFDRLCDEAACHGFKAVCVMPFRVAYVAEKLEGTRVSVCSVAGFPHGASFSDVKALEAKRVVAAGAAEVDMVLNIGALKEGALGTVERDIALVRNTVRSPVILKVIIETCLLTDDEKVAACKAAQNAGADFVKTSTGLAGGGATVEDIALMRETVGPDMGVKASGGIRDRATAVAMIEAGATRLGTSAGVAIVSA